MKIIYNNKELLYSIKGNDTMDSQQLLIIVVVISVLVLMLLLILTISMLKKASKKKKLLKYFQDAYLRILKVDALDRAIVSPNDAVVFKTGPRKILVNVHEKSEITDKTHLLDMEKPWTIGRKPGENTICIRGDKTVSSIHCGLQVQNEVLYLVDLGSKNRTYYVPARGRNAWYLPQKGYQALTTGDVFYVGHTAFEVTIYDSNYGIV